VTYLIDAKRLEDIGVPREWVKEWEKKLETEVLVNNVNLKNFKAYSATLEGFTLAFESDFFADAYLMLTAAILVFVYSFTFLGSCSPIHIRMTPAVVGLFCVILSYTAGMSICF